MITYPNGQTMLDTLTGNWQNLSNDEFLYRYLLENTKLKACTDGLPDEEQKVLKYFGIKYWEPGMDKVWFDGKVYKTIKTANSHPLLANS